MNTGKSFTKPRRRWLRVLVWCGGCLGAFCVLALAAGAWWLWAWKWTPELKFHESWTAAERSALAEFDAYLKQDLQDAVADYAGDFILARLCVQRVYGAPVCAQLREIARMGNAAMPGIDSYLGRGYTPAIVASQQGHYEALLALLRHGAEPNACVRINLDELENVVADMPITCVLSGPLTYPKRTIPWEQRREVAETLLQLGADLNAGENIIETVCSVALLRGEAEPWFWVIEKGRKVGAPFLRYVMSYHPERIELAEAMLRSTPGLANACHNGRTPLQALAEDAVCAEAETLPYLEKWLTLLLQHGADPGLLPDADEEDPDAESETRLPVEILQESRQGKTKGASEPLREELQRMCDMLQRERGCE